MWIFLCSVNHSNLVHQPVLSLSNCLVSQRLRMELEWESVAGVAKHPLVLVGCSLSPSLSSPTLRPSPIHGGL